MNCISTSVCVFNQCNLAEPALLSFHRKEKTSSLSPERVGMEAEERAHDDEMQG